MSLDRVPIWSPNYSDRKGATVTTIVLHTAEGALTYQELGSYFGNPAVQASSHVGIDDTPNTVGEYVQRGSKAWTASDANPWSVQAELCAFASWTADDWAAHPTMLANTAAWVAEEADYFGIPLDLLSPDEAQDPSVRGVCQHNDLGSMGGGHWDCGPDFPIDDVLAMARGETPDTVPQPRKDDDMPYCLFAPNTGGRWWFTDMRANSRPCDSLDDAKNVDWFLISQAQVDGLVCNRDASGTVAGPIAVDAAWLEQITAHAAAPAGDVHRVTGKAVPEQDDGGHHSRGG